MTMWKTTIRKRYLLGISAALLTAAPVSLHWTPASAAGAAAATNSASQEYKYPVGRSANEGGMGYNVQNSTFPPGSPELYAACLNRNFGTCPQP